MAKRPVERDSNDDNPGTVYSAPQSCKRQRIDIADLCSTGIDSSAPLCPSPNPSPPSSCSNAPIKSPELAISSGASQQTPPSVSVRTATPTRDVRNGEEPDNSCRIVEAENTICFGMISSIAIQGAQSCPGLNAFAPVVVEKGKVSIQGQTEPLGSISSEESGILEAIRSNAGCELQTYCSHVPCTLRKQKSSANHSNAVPQMRICVVIYGPPDIHDELGDYLEKCNIFLQDPLRCERDVEYRNPHRLFPPFDGICNTFQFRDAVLGETQDYDTPIDILSGLEYTYDLQETPTPSVLRTALFKHQQQALTFMIRRERGWALHPSSQDIWRAEHAADGSVQYINNITDEKTTRSPQNFRGGILADQMGLGKTLTTIALIASDQDHFHENPPIPPSPTGVKATLLVVRAPLLKMWENQLTQHTLPGRLRWYVHHRERKIKSLVDLCNYDIVLTTYNTLVAELKRHSNSPQVLFSVRWRRVMLDEAHDIRDHRRATCKAVCDLDSVSRWAVTGTPIQNQLLDLASLLQFLQVYPYETTTSFRALINHLSTTFELASATQRLRSLVQSIMLRRAIGSVTLPERHDLIIRLDFTTAEQELYNMLKARAIQPQDDVLSANVAGSSSSVLQTINQMRMACNLGTLLKLRSSFISQDVEQTWSETIAQERFNGFLAAGSAPCQHCRLELGAPATEVADHASDEACPPLIFECGWLLCGGCRQSLQRLSCGCKDTAHTSFPVSAMSSSTPLNLEIDHDFADMPTKIRALLADLDAHVGNEKCIVVSFWTSTLDLIGQGLDNKSISYIRFDGKIAQGTRNKALEDFSKPPAIRVALLTISCGAVGLDLTAASRAYLMEPHWNPSVEAQALARIHRMGQTRPVTTIRYVIRNTLEDHVLKVQHEKQELSRILLSESNGTKSADRIETLKSLL